MSLLREELLAGRRIALAGSVGEGVVEALRELGAELEPLPAGELGSDEDATGDWARARAPLHAIVYAASASFGTGGPAALAATLEEAWVAVREVATGALIPGQAHGKVVLVGPAPGAGPLAESVRAGLENLVRTLSVEWARYGISSVMVAPGHETAEPELATLISFLASPAAEYLSGCRLELGSLSSGTSAPSSTC